MIFWGSERDFGGSMKDAGIFLGRGKKKQGFFGELYFSSAQINNKISTINCWGGIFWGYAKKGEYFW